MPKVSVIIPCFNVETYLSQCLDSVLGQTLQDIEVICVDDGSTDTTLEILQQYQQNDGRLKIVQQCNLGAGAARNNGLRYATGEYFSFLDADDFFHADMLSKAVEKAQQDDAQIVLYRTQRFWESTEEYTDCDWTIKTDNIAQKEVFSAADVQKNFFETILGYTWDKLFKAEYIRKNNFQFQEQPVYNDAYFVYTALLKAERISLVDEPLCYQRKRAAKNSITNRRALFFDCVYKLLKGIEQFLKENDLYSRYEQDYKNYAIHLFSEDLAGRKGRSRQTTLSYLRTKWMVEFDLIHEEGYYYNLEEYQKLYNSVYHTDGELDLSIISLDKDIVIPVVFATDMGYLKYTIVSMCSILHQPTINISYRFVVLTPKHEGDDYRTEIEKVLRQFSNYTLEIIEIGNEFDNAHLEIAHITTPTYYRLLLPNLLPDCDKCIYIDGDTIACEDLFSLYATNIGDNYIGAVEALIYYERAEYHSERLNIGEKDNFVYYNAGVLLMNLEQMRRENMVDRFMSLLDIEFESQDQDIINVACEGRVKRISPAYNVMTRYHKWDNRRFKDIGLDDYAEEFLIADKKPVVIHYADKIKPWNNTNAVHAKFWWRIVLDCCWELFREEKLDLVMSAMYRKGKRRRGFGHKLYMLLPKKVRGGIQCCKDHGFVYTVKYGFQKLFRVKAKI